MKCKVCNNPILHKDNKKYCSRACQSVGYSKGTYEKKCAQCGKNFPVPYRRRNTAKNCSIKCTGEWTRKNRRGENNPRWKGGLTPLRKKLYFSPTYKLWRTAVFERDHYTCVFCGKKGVVLNADHIKPWSLFPELRFAIDNGRTLCVECHRKTDTYGWKIAKKHGTQIL